MLPGAGPAEERKLHRMQVEGNPIEQSGPWVGSRFLRLASGEAVARFVAFGVSLYLARRLGAAIYGTVALATAVMLYANYIVDCGVEFLGVRDVAAAPGEVSAFVPSIVLFRLLVAGVAVATLTLTGLILLPQPDGAVLAAYSFTLVAAALGTRWVLLGFSRTGTVGIARTAGEATAAVAALVLVRDIGGVVWVPVSQLAGDGLAALVLLLALRRSGIRLQVAYHWERVAPVLHRSWPLVLNALLGLLIFNCDFFFLRLYRDAATVGLYAVAYTLVSFLLNIGVMYGLSMLSPSMRVQGDPVRERALYVEALARSFAVTLPAALGASLLASGLVDAAFGIRYQASALALTILVWSIPAALFRNVAAATLIARGRQHDLLVTSLWAAGFNLALNFALIPRLGMVGAAAATVLTEVLRTALAFGFVVRAGLPLPPVQRFWRSLAAGLALALAVVLSRGLPLLAVVGLGAAAYGAALTLLGGVRFKAGVIPELAV
jgi:O-antigen/teichoic acid export membrane protein